MAYIRTCPDCKKTLTYSSYKNLWRANSRNVSCIDCTKNAPRKPKSTKYSRECPSCNKKILYSSIETLKKSATANRLCNSCTQRIKSKGRPHTEATKRKISQNHSRYWLGKKKPMSSNAKAKLRISTIKFIENAAGKCYPRYNPSACMLFDTLNKTFNWEGVHAENGGEYHIKELGYWVDYYEPNLNLVIEYDEKRHDRKINKDIERQAEIEELLRCKFIRIKETDSLDNVFTKLKEVI